MISFAGLVAGPSVATLMVWIVGHSFVKWAQRQARQSYFGESLGFNDKVFQVVWKGKGGIAVEGVNP